MTMKSEKLKKVKTSSRLQWPGIGLTLRWRLALWTSGMFVVLCLGLLIFVNLTAGAGRSSQLQSVSLVGFGLVTIIGGVGAYWLAGSALRPLKEVSQAARTISANTLDTRLNLSGPTDELKELAQAFDAMLDRLEQTFEQQNRFVLDAAHELRTPLATLRINLEVVAADDQATLQDYQRVNLTLERGLSRLERLIADLLTLATEEQNLIQEEIALSPLLEEVITNLEAVAQSTQVELGATLRDHLQVEGDGVLLAQVFSNLIENALRYNRPGGKVVLEVFRRANTAIVTVRDTGIGIAPTDQVHIFERFYRADQSRSRHRGGAGLGLSIARHIAHQHKGQVELIHSSSEGSTFQVQLPLSAIPASSQNMIEYDDVGVIF